MGEISKETFNGYTGQIAVDLGLLTDEQRNKVLDIQAKFAALAEKGVEPTEKFLDNDPLFKSVNDNWKDLAEKHGITDADLAMSKAKVQTGTGVNNAPASGDIANALGYVDKVSKNAILTAQAAVRAETLLDPNTQAKSEEIIGRIHGRIDREGKFGDPKELIDAQLNNEAADKLKAGLDNGGKTAEEIRQGAIKAYQDAANMFDTLGKPEIAESLREYAENVPEIQQQQEQQQQQQQQQQQGNGWSR